MKTEKELMGWLAGAAHDLANHAQRCAKSGTDQDRDLVELELARLFNVFDKMQHVLNMDHIFEVATTLREFGKGSPPPNASKKPARKRRYRKPLKSK